MVITIFLCNESNIDNSFRYINDNSKEEKKEKVNW